MPDSTLLLYPRDAEIESRLASPLERSGYRIVGESPSRRCLLDAVKAREVSS